MHDWRLLPHHYYLGFSITTCLNTPAGIRDLTSWLPSVVVPSLLMYRASPADASDSSRWSSLVFFSSSSMIRPVLTRVPSTRPDTVGRVALALTLLVPLMVSPTLDSRTPPPPPFFRRSTRARSSEPVSLIGMELELGFL